MTAATDDGPGGPRHSYCVTLAPDWGAIDRLRDFVVLWTQPLVRDETAREVISGATSELLENAIRHGGRGRVEFEISVGKHSVHLRVTNRIDPDAGRVEALAERVRWINTITPADAYQIQIELEAAGAPSGLGLARIANQGCTLACSLKPFEQKVAVEASLMV